MAKRIKSKGKTRTRTVVKTKTKRIYVTMGLQSQTRLSD